MPLDMNYFRAIQGSLGCATEKDTQVEDVRRRFSYDFDTSINAVYDASRNEVQQDFIIVPTKEQNKCNVITRPGEEISIGDIIFWNKLHWLVTDKNFQSEIYNSATIVRCNRIIKWQNVKTLEIISRWCLCTKPYTSNIEDGKILSTSNREYKIQLPFDSETRLIDLDKRFLLEEIGGVPRAYKMTSVDTLTNRYEDIDGGFLIWNLTQDTYDVHKDNAELMIADYIDPGAPPAPPPGPDPTLLKCEILGRDCIKCGASAIRYDGIFYLSDNKTVAQNINMEWAVSFPQNLEKNFDFKVFDSYITLRALDSEDIIGEKVEIKLVDSLSLYEQAKKIIEIVPL